jgi:hypothetical protein
VAVAVLRYRLWDLGAVHGHDGHHRHPRAGQDLRGLVGFEVRRP